MPGSTSFSLTKRRQDDLWRRAIVSAEGSIADEGWEPTQADAKRSAVGALH